MRALSFHQPWAWAILHAGKHVENRTRPTRHRGPLLVHAALTRKSHAAQDPDQWQRVYGVTLPPWEELRTGVILGMVDVVGCEQNAGDLGKWAEPSAWCWLLESPRVFREPIVLRGCQNLFEVDDDLIPAEFRVYSSGPACV